MKKKVLTCEISLITLLSFIVLLLGGCVTTAQTRKVEPAGFLKDYSQLKEGEDDQALMVYINPEADFPGYDKVLLDPVTLWRNPNKPPIKIPEDELQSLLDYLNSALRVKLSKDYEMVNRSGPGVMRIRCAITELKKSRVVLDIASSVMPPAIALNALKNIATGTSSFVGRAAIEVEILDSLTNVRLAAAVDKRAGGKVWDDDKTKKWGDVAAAFDYWAEKLQKKLKEFRK
jgi:hypothetical protein